MKIQFYTLFIIILFFSSYSSCNNSRKIAHQKNEGLVIFHTIDYLKNKSNIVVDDYNYKLWYLDSSIIKEYVYISFDFLPDTNSKPPSLETLKYVYVNLKNLHYQDYMAFDSAAAPSANYKFEKDGIGQFNFYDEDDYIPPIYNTPNVKLPDTIIEKVRYKRILFKGDANAPFWQRILYLTDKYSQNFIHLDRRLNKKYYPFKVMRADDYTYGKISTTSYYDEIKTKLSDNEKAVFKRWSLNADTTTLPVLTLEEVREIDSKELGRRSKENR